MKNLSFIKFYPLLLIAFLFPGCEKNEIENFTANVIMAEDTTVEDIDRNVYQTVKIGDQIWMSEILRVARFRNGDPIPTTQPLSLCIANETEPCYFWKYEDAFNFNVCTYYTWAVISDERQIAPEGWHVPSWDEWNLLFENIENNPEKFEHVAYGYRCCKGVVIKEVIDVTFWWTSTEYDETRSYIRSITTDNSQMALYLAGKNFGLPIICVKDYIDLD